MASSRGITPRLKINIVANWLAHGVGLAVGFFLMPYVIRVLGNEEYGTWVFINSIASYSGLMYLGFGQTLSRYVAMHATRNDWLRVNQSVTVVFISYLAMGVLALIISGGLAWWLPVSRGLTGKELLEMRGVILVLGLNVACAMAGSVFGGVLQGLQRFDLQRLIFVSSALLRLGLTLSVLRHEWSLLTLASIFLAATLAENLTGGILAAVFAPQLRIRPRFWDWTVARECFGFSLTAFLGQIGLHITSASDAIVIGMTMGMSSIVPYNVASRLCQFIQRPIGQIGDVCLPRAGELLALSDSQAILNLVTRAMGLAFKLSFGMLIGAYYFGDSLIATWIGPEYADSHMLLVILLAGQAVALPCGVLRSIFLGMGDATMPAVLQLLGAGLNIALSLALVPHFGLLGVAIGVTVPMVLCDLLGMVPYALCRLRISPVQLAAGVIGPVTFPLLALTVFSALVDHHWPGATGWHFVLPVALGGGGVLVATWYVQRTILQGREDAPDYVRDLISHPEDVEVSA